MLSTPQPSLAAGAAGHGDLKPASSPGPVSDGIERARRTELWTTTPAIQRTGELRAEAVYLSKDREGFQCGY